MTEPVYPPEVSEEDIMRWDAFVYWGQRFYDAQPFKMDERNGKIAIAAQLGEARDALQANSSDWVDLLSQAFKLPGSLMNPQSYSSFVTWCRREQEGAAAAFRLIWDSSRPLAARFDDFIDAVRSSDGRAQIAEAAFPNMAIDPRLYPMFRAEPVAKAMTLTGYADPRSLRRAHAGVRYEHYLSFLDRIIAEAGARDFDLQDRLDAQGMLWCVTTGEPRGDWPEQDRIALSTYRQTQAADQTSEGLDAQPSQKFWAFLANPDRYQIEDAVKELAYDCWTTRKQPVRAGDRVLIWKTKGLSDQRGIVALGEVLSDPEERLPKSARFWLSPDEVVVEPRVTFRYVLAPGMPLWLSTHNAEFLNKLPVSRARGGPVFALTGEQWESVINLMGGWPGDVPSVLVSVADVAQAAAQLDLADEFDVDSLDDARERVSRMIAARQGQPTFRATLIEAYEGRCAVTGCAITELLEAAHIHPYYGPKSNDVRNGLLLRTDIHTLFDLGLLTVDPDTWTVTLDSRLNDSEYAQLARTSVRLPLAKSAWPSTDALRLRLITG